MPPPPIPSPIKKKLFLKKQKIKKKEKKKEKKMMGIPVNTYRGPRVTSCMRREAGGGRGA
jgi:hypothetical protein